jgi:cytoskeletal protein CcmA (bactofilin family)
MSEKSALSQAFSELLSTVAARPAANQAGLAKAESRPGLARSESKGYEDSSMAKTPSPKSEPKVAEDLKQNNDRIEREPVKAPNPAPPPAPELKKPVPEPKKPASPSQKVTTIAAGTTILGNMVIEGAAELEGILHGDIECSGCLTVSGEIVGCSKTAEIDVLGARVEGNIESKGNVQIRDGAVVIGNVTGQSMQVDGALKGDILLPGHLRVGPTAIIVGDIQTGTIDIQNGAVIDGRVTVQAAEKAEDIFATKLGRRSASKPKQQPTATRE